MKVNRPGVSQDIEEAVARASRMAHTAIPSMVVSAPPKRPSCASPSTHPCLHYCDNRSTAVNIMSGSTEVGRISLSSSQRLRVPGVATIAPTRMSRRNRLPDGQRDAGYGGYRAQHEHARHSLMEEQERHGHREQRRRRGDHDDRGR